MEKRKIIKIWSLILVFVLFIGLVPIGAKADDAKDKGFIEPENNVFIQLDGENVEAVSMAIDEKVELKIHTTIEDDNLDYRWEILVDKGTSSWVTIYDWNSVNITVSYGMLSNFLDENNLIQLRAVVMSGEDTYISDSVLIEVAEKNVESENEKISLSDLSPTSDDDENMVTITINYLKSTGEQVCDPYIASIYKGMHFATTVLSPVVTGYEPKLNESDVELADEYVFDFDSVNEDVVINIFYYPVEVKYEVRYYMQNIYDDDYVMTGNPVVAYGKVGTEPDESLINANFDGFVRVNYQPELIASDGSTVFQCFYEREYYLIDLDLDGGYGVDSVYAKYDTVFVVNTPEKAGYIFAGWDMNDDGVADEMLNTIPSSNVSYKALWATTDTTYTVVYWTENANNSSYDYVGSRKVEAVSSSVVSGTDDLDDVYICSYEEHEHSFANGCYNCKEHVCSISCYATSSAYKTVSELSGTTLTVYNSLVSKASSNTKNGYVYKYRSGSTYYNFFYINNMWYYLGTGNSYCGITLSGALSNPSRNNYNSVSARACSYSYPEDSMVCTKKEHSHSDDCIVDTTYYEFVSADENVIVNGDGSSVVNVYYTRKKYTLRFYYARSNGNTVEVVGGTTYPFGALHSSTNENTSIQTLLENVTQWGEVEDVPTVMDAHKSKYTIDSITYGNYTYYYLEFTEKYGSDIGDLWAIGIFNPVKIDETNVIHTNCDEDYAYFSAWNGEYRVKYTQDHKSINNGNETIKGCYMYLDENIIFDSKFEDVSYEYETGKESSLVSFLGFWDNGANVSWSVPELYIYNLMVKSLDGNGYSLYKAFDTYDDSDVANQTATNIKGFAYTGYDYNTISNGSDGSMEQYSINFYYDRNEYNLSFYNYNTEVSSQNILYGASLTDKYFEPEYPSTLEKNAYEFDGWYTTAGCFAGSEFNFDGETMPSNNLVLYAKWIPVTHTVTFYNTYQDMVGGKEALSVVDVPHGAVLESSDVPDVYNDGYLAGEWFYIKNGEKVAYRPISIAVKNDLKVYRDWSSNMVVEYTVYYYKNGTTEKVAEPSTGWMFDGSTKTFKAKGGGELAELYDEYNEGWYPTVSSTSIVADKDNENVVIFYYDYQNPNPYTVKYVDADTGVEIADRKVVSDNSKSVVTEVYKVVSGYVPDAYYKQLVLALNKEEDADKNVLTFYYSKASNSAYYAIEYYFMNTDGKTYHLNAKIQSPIAVGSTANIPEISSDGYLFEKCMVKDGDADTFTEVSEKEMKNIVVDEDGALIKVYYEREKTSYVVHYYIAGTETSLKDDKNVNDIYFGTAITEEAGENVEGYTLVSDKSQTKELVLNADYNVFTFYYEETLKTARYKAVCRDERFAKANFGAVSSTLDVKKWSDDYESVTIYEKDKFYFAGWYSDKELTNLVSKNKTITPDVNTDITYYAVFEPYFTDLTIKKSVDGTVDKSQTYIFNVVGTDATNSYVNILVTVHGDGESKVCHLPLGNYKVVEDTAWSWKYNPVGAFEKEIEVEMDARVNVVEFTNSIGNSAWLSGNDYDVNIFD